jgi:hypothetical protein
MGGVPVTFVDVVGVALVRHRDVAAVRAMPVGVLLMRGVLGRRALVGVAFVDAVDVSVVDVVGVVAVRERDMAAALAVNVRVFGVGPVLGRGAHLDGLLVAGWQVRDMAADRPGAYTTSVAARSPTETLTYSNFCM